MGSSTVAMALNAVASLPAICEALVCWDYQMWISDCLSRNRCSSVDKSHR